MRLLLHHMLLLLFTAGIASAQYGWVQQNPASPDSILFSVAHADVNTVVAVGEGGVIRRTTDAGASWTRVFAGTTARLQKIRFLTAGIGVLAGEKGLVLRSNDGGATWTHIRSRDSDSYFDMWFFDANTGYVAGTSNKNSYLAFTSDGGGSWTARSTPFGPNTIHSICFVSRQVGWICGNAGEIARTTDGGVKWTAQQSPKSATLNAVSFFDPMHGTIVGDAGVILGTADGGRTWKQQFPAFPLSSSLMAVQQTDSLRAYAAGWFGIVLRTIDGGVNWQAQAVPDEQFFEGVSFVDDRIGTVVGWKSTILRTMTGGILGIDGRGNGATHGTGLMLAQNIPNPVALSTHTSTTITYTVSRSSRAVLTLHDALGRRVTTLLDEQVPAGSRTLVLPVATLSAGVYFYRLAADGDVRTRRLIITK